jgi:hypothetical protein
MCPYLAFEGDKVKCLWNLPGISSQSSRGTGYRHLMRSESLLINVPIWLIYYGICQVDLANTMTNSSQGNGVNPQSNTSAL